MKPPFLQLKVAEFRASPTDTFHLKDYSIPENFPNDSQLHIELQPLINEWYDEFPDCCPRCRELPTKNWFKKEDYKNVPLKILRQLSYTEHCIKIAFNSSKWYEYITEYIDYNIRSFGEPNVGEKWYRLGVKSYITNIAQKEIALTDDKKEKLLQYIYDLENPPPAPTTPMTDPNVLFFLFQKWLETIPNLEFFKAFKNRYHNKAPTDLMFDVVKKNRFTGLSLMEIKKPDEFIDTLITLTKNLLHSTQTKIALQKGLISDLEQHEMDLMFETHEKEQIKALRVKYTEHEFQYIEIMSNWLNREEQFFQKNSQRIKKYANSLKLIAEPQKVKPTSFVQLFRSNNDRLGKFFELLKTDNIKALDKENNWIYNKRKSSIVACFQALEDLDIIKKSTNKAELRRIIESEINFSGNEKLFRNDYNQEDYQSFKTLFSNHLK